MTNYKLMLVNAGIAGGIVFLTTLGVAHVPTLDSVYAATISGGLIFLKDIQIDMTPDTPIPSISSIQASSPTPEPPAPSSPSPK
jgi:hypothetical protein